MKVHVFQAELNYPQHNYEYKFDIRFYTVEWRRPQI